MADGDRHCAINFTGIKVVEAVPATVSIDDSHVVMASNDKVVTSDHLEGILGWRTLNDGLF